MTARSGADTLQHRIQTPTVKHDWADIFFTSFGVGFFCLMLMLSSIYCSNHDGERDRERERDGERQERVSERERE